MPDDLGVIALLEDPQRRALYRFVVEQRRDVSRNEAAQAVGVSRTLAAFHLDRLADAGLLEVSFKRLNTRSGPGAGRPAKLYRAANTEHSVSIPPRDYARAARVLADAIDRSGAEEALYRTAREEGVRSGMALANRELTAELAERGYAPYLGDDATVRLRNCPFHALAKEFPVLACGMNLALIQGLLHGAQLGTRSARLDPRPGECCVVISKNNDD
jgi:predicted ArsR family transcriptional regulator